MSLKFRKSPFSGIFRNRINWAVFAAVFVCLSLTNLAYAQTDGSAEEPALLDVLASELIAALVGFLGLGISALLAWLRNRGIPVSSEQEAMFRNIVTQRFQQLAKDSWTHMREHPEKIDEYWKELARGRIPKEFADRLRKEGLEFAMQLKDNKEFKDFAKNVTEHGMYSLLKDLRTTLKNDYQRRMIDVLPMLASTAVDSAFDPSVTDVKTWGVKSLKNLRPLLLSAEAIDTEENL